MNEQTKMACPICGRTLTENDKLILTWNPKGWWVTWHMYKGDTQPNGSPRDAHTMHAYEDHLTKYYNWCAQADIQTAIPV